MVHSNCDIYWRWVRKRYTHRWPHKYNLQQQEPKHLKYPWLNLQNYIIPFICVQKQAKLLDAIEVKITQLFLSSSPRSTLLPIKPKPMHAWVTVSLHLAPSTTGRPHHDLYLLDSCHLSCSHLWVSHWDLGLTVEPLYFFLLNIILYGAFQVSAHTFNITTVLVVQ